MKSLFGLLMLIAPIACFTQTEPHYHSDTLSIMGAVLAPMSLTLNDLASFTQVKLDSVRIVNHRGEYKSTLRDVVAVKLTDLIDSAGIEDKPRHLGAYFFVCTAVDGYTTVYSWNELYNGKCGDAVMVVLSVAGETKLEDGILMINGCDTYSGRRHIKWLRSVEVRKA